MLMAALGMSAAAHAWETPSGSTIAPFTFSAKARAKSGRRGGQIKFLPGSAETVKERSTRLKRECKGAVNAGACAGYTR